MSDKNRAGAIVHKAKQDEEKLDEEIDRKNRGRRFDFGGDEPNMAPRYESVNDLVAFLGEYGITVRTHTHPKTRDRWLNERRSPDKHLPLSALR